MSGDFADDAWAPPAFEPEAALMTLRRQLREHKGLSEKTSPAGPGFDWQGKRVVELRTDSTTGTLLATLAKRPAVSPEWERFPLKSSADLRKFNDEVKKRLARWDDE